jgi:hypothetical protein
VPQGAREYVYSAANPTLAGTPALTYGLTNVFVVMSNELTTPRLLLCPSDDTRDYQTNFAFLTENFSNMSYFVGGDADEAYPQMILTGDRNIGITTFIYANRAALSTNSIDNAPGAFQWQYDEVTPKRWTWTAKGHLNVGNIGTADGGAQQVNNVGLRAALFDSSTNSSSINPFYNFPQ